MKSWIVALLIVLSAPAKAGNFMTGIEAAEEICSRLHYSTTISECVGVVQKAHYMDEKAVGVCGKQWIYYVGSCFESISNKRYTASEILKCRTFRTHEGISECFSTTGTSVDIKDAGKEIDGQIDRKLVVATLQKVLTLISKDPKKAELMVQNLIDTL